MTVVTVRANRGALIAAGHGFRMHTLAVRKKGPIADAAASHYGLVAMTFAARLGNPCAVDRGIWISARQDGRHVTVTGMTIETGRRLSPVANCLGMKAVVVTGMGS